MSAHVFLLDRGRVLLVRRSSEAAYAPNSWHASVAGKVEPGEDVVAAAVRECAEELGIRVNPADLEFGHVMHSQENTGWIHFFFVCRQWDGSIANTEPHKHTDMDWFPAHRLPTGTVGYCAQALAHTLTGEGFSQHQTNTPFPLQQRSAHEQPALGDAGIAGSLAWALEEIADERRRQQSLYGIQDLPFGTGPEHTAQAERVKARVDAAGADLTWWDLAFEELCEARAAPTVGELRAELVQTCAVLVQWTQALYQSPVDGPVPPTRNQPNA
ncbi:MULTISPECIES: NUDIX domain-containing protein [unclassified Nocardiopsis]|uniref:NUDIX domain-containing protein n=1 Tax=unclassified Nocardiopsis TaxID=2649073 RepID=UPI001F2F0345|nr:MULTISPECIES: NUDIX domain-containing protein [unclassified Nocardiopsis]